MKKIGNKEKEKLRELILGTECNLQKIREVSLQVVMMMDENKFNGLERRILLALLEDIINIANNKLLYEKMFGGI